LLHCDKEMALRLVVWGLGGLATVAALAGVAIWATTPSPAEGQVMLPAKTPYTSGEYFAYAQPWGGEKVAITRVWAPYADHIAIDPRRFPNNTVTHWRWPPFAPRGGPGVWSYQAVMHGNYDGGETETKVPPVRLRDLGTFSQSFSWKIDNRLGDANVLTEFYLRSSPTDPDAKLLEIGWLLHMPAHSRRYFESARKIGTYTDAQGRRWDVRIDGKFCMFAPPQPTDITDGTLDMAAALRWLEQHHTVTGDQWVWGVSFGSEAVQGKGQLVISHWSVEKTTTPGR
jgi:hypothetical protein